MWYYATVLYLIGVGVTASASSDSVAKMHPQMSSGSGRDHVTGKPVTSLNNGIVAPTASTHISLDTLFKGASKHHDSSEINLFRFHALMHIQMF